MARIASWSLSLFRILKDESGATAIEYALLSVLIVVVIVSVVATVGTNLSGLYSTVAADL